MEVHNGLSGEALGKADGARSNVPVGRVLDDGRIELLAGDTALFAFPLPTDYKPGDVIYGQVVRKLPAEPRKIEFEVAERVMRGDLSVQAFIATVEQTVRDHNGWAVLALMPDGREILYDCDRPDAAYQHAYQVDVLWRQGQ